LGRRGQGGRERKKENDGIGNNGKIHPLDE
jgi:hypothetical protein